MNEELTVGMVNEAVEHIRKIAGDDEAAHSEEDGLWHDVLLAIAENRVDDPKVIAKAALQTQHIKFARWCA